MVQNIRLVVMTEAIKTGVKHQVCQLGSLHHRVGGLVDHNWISNLHSQNTKLGPIVISLRNSAAHYAGEGTLVHVYL